MSANFLSTPALFGVTALFAVAAHSVEMCPLDSAYPGFSESVQQQAPRPEAVTQEQCFIAWRDIAPDLADYQLVDIRRAEHYEAAHLAAAIHVPPQQIKTKIFLRSRKALLIGYGFERQSLMPLCSELRHRGFQNLFILDGGIDVALRNGVRAIAKTPVSRTRLMSPEQLVSEFFSDGLHVIVGDKDLQVGLRNFGVTSAYLEQQIGSEPWAAAARRVQLQNTPEGTPKRPFVVVGQHGPVLAAEQAARHDLWQLEASAQELLQFLERSEWTRIKRNSTPTRFQCPNL